MTPPRDLAAPTLLAWLAGALMTSPGHVGRAVGAGRSAGGGGGGDDAVTLRCPRACFCNTPSHIVYCSRRGLSAIPPDVPADTLQLNLNGNLFTSSTITRSLSHTRTSVINQSINQSINQGFFYSGLSNLNHCEVHYSARRKDCCSRNVFK